MNCNHTLRLILRSDRHARCDMACYPDLVSATGGMHARLQTKATSFDFYYLYAAQFKHLDGSYTVMMELTMQRLEHHHAASDTLQSKRAFICWTGCARIVIANHSSMNHYRLCDGRPKVPCITSTDRAGCVNIVTLHICPCIASTACGSGSSRHTRTPHQLARRLFALSQDLQRRAVAGRVAVLLHAVRWRRRRVDLSNQRRSHSAEVKTLCVRRRLGLPTGGRSNNNAM